MRQLTVFAMLLAAVALTGAGCLGTNSTGTDGDNVQTAGDSGMRGTAMIGPTCPVETFPPQEDCSDKPYAGSFVIKTKAGARVTTVQSGADGTFTVKLAPGDYVISLANEGSLPSMASQEFTVITDTYTVIFLSLDSGIR